MTKKDASEISLAEPPPGFGPVGEAGAKSAAGMSLDEATPVSQRTAQLTAGIPPSRRKMDREASPSEKQVYVPPVTLPPNKEPQAPDAHKIMVAPSVMVSSDERSRPTMRRIPVVMPPGSPDANAPAPQGTPRAQGEAGSPPRAQGVRTARFDAPIALPPPPEDLMSSVRGMPAQAHKVPGAGAAGAPFTKKSPWARDGAAHLDKANLPSAQLLSTTAPLAAPKPSPGEVTEPQQAEAPRSMLGRVLILAGVLVVAAVGVWYLVRWPTPAGGQPPIDVTVKAVPGPAAPSPATADTVPPAEAAAAATAPPAVATAPPPAAVPPAAVTALPPPAETPPVVLPPSTTARKPTRPPSTKPTAGKPSEPSPTPAPSKTTTAPPRPF